MVKSEFMPGDVVITRDRRLVRLLSLQKLEGIHPHRFYHYWLAENVFGVQLEGRIPEEDIRAMHPLEQLALVSIEGQ